jgi:hypothetical protein
VAAVQDAEGPLGAAAGFRRVGRDVLDAELRQRPPDLGRLILGTFAPALGVLNRWLARSAQSAQGRPCVAITSASARKALIVPSSSTRNAE